MSEQKIAELPFSLKEKIEALKASLLSVNPAFGTILNEIHMITGKNPEYVYAMSDEEFQTIVAGYSKFMNVTVDATKTVSKKQGALLDENSV